MAITIEELKEKLKGWDEVILVDALGLTSEDIVEAFPDVIQAKYDQLISEYEEDEENETF